MSWTHGFDLLLKLLTLFVVIAASFLVPGLMEAHPVVIMPVAIIGWLGAYHLLGRTISTWLYARFTLRMPLSYAEAVSLNDAFSPAWPLQRQWLPMKDLRDMDPAVKLSVAQERLAAWKGEQVIQKEERSRNFRERTTANKAALVLLLASIPYLLLASIMVLPPADRVLAVYADGFHAEEY